MGSREGSIQILLLPQQHNIKIICYTLVLFLAFSNIMAQVHMACKISIWKVNIIYLLNNSTVDLSLKCMYM